MTTNGQTALELTNSKALGLKMGTPLFKAQHLVEEYNADFNFE